MTDRELLERAARAAGIRALWGPDGICRDATGAAPAMNLFGMPRWDPLTDDGDAMRLAVALRLTLRLDDPNAACAGVNAHQIGAPTLDGRGPWFRKEWNGEDPCAATRLAIVRAAAEMAP